MMGRKPKEDTWLGLVGRSSIERGDELVVAR